MYPLPRHSLQILGGLLLSAQALSAQPLAAQPPMAQPPSSSAPAMQAGLRQQPVPGATPDAPATAVALYYPTEAPARAITMGPFTVHVAPGAPPVAAFKGLIVVSHGTGGTELGHASLAEALARHGYLVAALRHPGDNFQDRSLLQQGSGRYFSERPRQVSRVIDALLQDATWGDRIAKDARGPLIGAVGHSAGGYTVLALAGGQPDLSRLGVHCREHETEDPIFCQVGPSRGPAAGNAASGEVAAGHRAAATAPAALIDPRVRAVVALSPVGAVFDASSLAAVRVPARIYVAEGDRFLVPRFHGDWIARHLPGADLRRVAHAGHFAFMDVPSIAIQTEDGDIRADPPGFDRSAFLARLQRELPAFFDQALR